MADKTLKSLNFGGADNYFPLPLVTAADNDKILSVVNGEWTATDMPIIPTESNKIFIVKKEIPEIKNFSTIGDGSVADYLIYSNIDFFPITVNDKTYNNRNELWSDYTMSQVYFSVLTDSGPYEERPFVLYGISGLRVFMNESAMTEPLSIPSFTLVIIFCNQYIIFMRQLKYNMMYTLKYNFDGKDFCMDVDIKDYANKLPNIKLIE